jgi:PPOX class probable F420-dependent enzyme
MSLIDPATEEGRKVTRWLEEEIIAWLVTVTPDGTPVPTPVWFWWDGETLLVYSQAGKPKLRHIAANPRVAVALQLDEVGDLRAVITGEAAVDESVPRLHRAAGLGRRRVRRRVLGRDPDHPDPAAGVVTPVGLSWPRPGGSTPSGARPGGRRA